MPAQPDDKALLSSYLSAPPEGRGDDNPLLISYLTLRKAVGLSGILLPFVLAIGKLLLQGPGLQRSVSSYYHTILACVTLIPVAWLLFAVSQVGRLAPVFWLEALAIVAFGVSWLTKGEAILKDRKPRAARVATPSGAFSS